MKLHESRAQDSLRKAADIAADEIRRQIQQGLLAPGQRLIEAELMNQLPVGRSTLREAFLKLAAEGLVELQHQRGACVRRMTRADLAELFQMRECLEGYACALAAARVEQGSNRAWLREARSVWLAHDVLDNELTHMENNVPLHDGIVAMAANSRLRAALKLLELPGYRLQFLRLLDREQRAISARQHIDIIDALVAGKAAQAEKLMRAHVRRAALLAQNIAGLA
jgi:DNA-binding GntR family transcriptional regulator